MSTRILFLIGALLVGVLFSAGGCAASPFKPEVDSFPIEVSLSGKTLRYRTPAGVKELSNTSATFEWSASDGLLLLNGEQFRPRVRPQQDSTLPTAATWRLFQNVPRIQELLSGASTYADSVDAFLTYVEERTKLERAAERLYADRVAVQPDPDNWRELTAQRQAADEALSLVLGSPLVESAYAYEQSGLVLSLRVLFAGFTVEHSIPLIPGEQYDEPQTYSQPPQRLSEEHAKLVVRNLIVKLRLQDVVDDSRGLSLDLSGRNR